MNPHDYIISVDENGEPYLEHALFGKGGQKKDHKYYARAQDKGRWRYFYSPEEFRLWSSGGSKKKSTSEKMKSAFKQLKESGAEVATNVRDKIAPQHKERMEAAEKNLREAKINLSENNIHAHALKRDWFSAKDKFDDYDTSMLKKYGRDYKSKMSDTEKNKYNEYYDDLSEKAEAGWNASVVQNHSGTDKNHPTLKDKPNAAQRVYDDEADYSFSEFAKDAVSNIGDKLKTKSERMREEFHKKASQAANDAKEKVKDKVQEKVDDIKETYEHNKRQFDKAKEMEKAEAERQEKLANRPKAHEKPEATGTAKDGAMKRRSMEKSTYSEYKDGDHDFDDDNYKEENRVGDSDFFIHKRKDGTNVILEEDMKWVLPKGVDAKSPAIQKAIKDFVDEVKSQRKLGNNYTGDQWRDAVTKAIDEAVRSTTVTTSQRQSNSGSGRSIDPHKASPEFMLEAGYNSGLDVSALKDADAIHAKAQRAYNKAISNPNTSSQEKDRLFRELTKAEKIYYNEADKIADELNQK